MKVTTELVGPREVELTIEPDAEFLAQAMRQAAQRISRYRPIRGYRPGRAPYALVERIYGREIILNEALEHEAQSIYEQAIREAAIEPLAQEQMSIASQEPVTLKVRVSLVPEVSLGDYKSISLEPKPPVSISEEELDRAIQEIRRRHAEITAVDRPLARGDQALMNIVG
ncbi:MAG: trigger factor, partial [Anaerolineae bacterium]